ncbi:serine hydrolase domain-containing protein [Sorangium sp. So ce118]
MIDIQGKCEGAFMEVREVFARNFAERGEVGASVCVTVGGKVVVDLHGGIADPATGKPWSSDTIGVVWSSTKGAAALCAHLLVDRGLLDLDAPVAAYWPEFAHEGKERIPVRMLLTHQAGVPALRKPVPPGGFYDWRGIVDALAAEAPFWEPGTRHGYHALVFGFLVGEVVRRVTGRSLGTFFQEEVARPLGLDFWIGLPASEEHRVAPYIPADPPARLQDMSAFFRAVVADPTSLQGLVAGNTGGFFEPSGYNTREAHAAEIPAANGVTNARGLAGMYAPLALGGAMGGVPRLDHISARFIPEGLWACFARAVRRRGSRTVATA